MPGEVAKGFVTLLGAGVAAHVSRGGWGRVPGEVVPLDVSKGQGAGLRELATLPCGAPRLPGSAHSYGVDGQGVGLDYSREWAVQRESLLAHFGGLAGRPALTAACAKAWVEAWLDAWAKAAKADPQRFSIYASQGVAAPRLTAWNGPVPNGKRSDLGRSWDRLRGLQNRAAWAVLGGDDGEWSHARAVAEELKTFALRMDSVGSRLEVADAGDLVGYVGESGKNLIEDAARGAGNVLAWGIEGVLAPVIGGAAAGAVGVATSALLPYLVVGGVGYLVWKKAS